jgi:chloramphenicol-sensitive protein RarD
VLPIYWKLMQGVPAVQIIGHRVVWSFITLMALIFIVHKWDGFRSAAFSGKFLRVYLVAAILIGINWLLYVWAVNAGHVIETSLGYFINPLLSVALGVVFFHERLRPAQWVSIGLVAAGVLFLAIVHGSLPWIALSLSVSFALYGLVKKTAPLGALPGLTLETSILLLPAAGYLLITGATGTGAFLRNGPTVTLLMAGAGIITVIPLLLFASASRRIPLSLMGILQYISPTLQFFTGVLIFREPFSGIQFVGYGLVWLALALFAVESFIAHQAAQAVVEA